MKQFWYRRASKSINILLQGLLVGLLVFCVLSISRWTEGNLSVTEMGRPFESTQMYLRTVERIVREKLSCDENAQLFEENGVFNDQKQIDIRQYVSGVMDTANYNLNTTYTIRDLLDFAENGADQLQERMQVLLDGGRAEDEAGAVLGEEAGTYETILPLSGMPLADFARMNANPGMALIEFYRNLCETSLDLGLRYEEYTSSAENGEHSQAPSNVAYYVENTGTRQRYSNMQANSLLAAQHVVEESENLTWLFEGERRFNIMVANTEHAYSETVSDWFMQTRFVGSGEIVLIAVDMNYPIGDDLRREYLLFQKREPYVLGALAACIIAAVLLVYLFVMSVLTAGRTEKGGPAVLGPFDQIPTEVAGGICLFAAILWLLGGIALNRRHGGLLPGHLKRPLLAGTEYVIVLLALQSLIRRIKAGSLWKNSVFYYVLLGTRQVYSARKSSQRLLILYVGFIVMNMISLLVGGFPGTVMALVLNLGALLYLMRDVVGNQTIREGLHQISEGRLDYRINTDALTGESREMGEAVNEMGEGLQKAVDSMLSNERLKAELITNVSHDLKTPLTSIISYVDLLRRETPQTGKAGEYLEILDQKTQRLKQLTEDLIEASKISSGNVELHPTELDLKQFLQQAVGEFEDRLDERNLKPQLSLCEEPVVIRADGAQLWRVFENLLGNVVKYAKEGTPLLCLLTCEDDQAQIRFENESAVPITVDAAHLLERFGRGDASRRTVGSGLGLSIAMNLTQLMGGSFDIEVETDRFAAVVKFPKKI